MNSHTVCVPGGVISHLVVDHMIHIAYLTTISISMLGEGDSLKIAIDYQLQLHVLLNSC